MKKNLKKNNITAFILIFIWLMISSLILQNWYPLLLSTLSPDSVSFEKSAFILAESIRSEGWENWRLAPNMQTPVGIASIFVILFHQISIPIVIFNAALLTTAAIIMANLSFRFGYGIIGYWVACTPFLLPSSVLITSVLHKDPFVVLAISCILYGLYINSTVSKNIKKYKKIYYGYMLVAIGGILIWLMRPYAIKMITLGIVGYAVALCIIQYVTIKHKNFNYVLKKELRSGLAMLSSLIVINAFLFLPLPFQIGETINDQKKGDHSACYNKNKWNFLNDLITARKNYYLTYPNANFNIDANYDITSKTNMLKYLPRAILLGFLAPFPHNIIKTNSKKPINNLVLIEIIIIYLGLFGLILSVFKIPDKTVPILVFCLITITIYVYAIPNIGTIYRLRMPYLWPLISLGLANLSNHCAFKNILQKLQKSLNNDITSI